MFWFDREVFRRRPGDPPLAVVAQRLLGDLDGAAEVEDFFDVVIRQVEDAFGFHNHRPEFFSPAKPQRTQSSETLFLRPCGKGLTCGFVVGATGGRPCPHLCPPGRGWKNSDLVNYIQSSAAAGQKLLALICDQHIFFEMDRALLRAHFRFQCEHHAGTVGLGFDFIQ